jgi:hypothetical protein
MLPSEPIATTTTCTEQAYALIKAPTLHQLFSIQHISSQPSILDRFLFNELGYWNCTLLNSAHHDGTIGTFADCLHVLLLRLQCRPLHASQAITRKMARCVMAFWHAHARALQNVHFRRSEVQHVSQQLRHAYRMCACVLPLSARARPYRNGRQACSRFTEIRVSCPRGYEGASSANSNMNSCTRIVYNDNIQ